MLVGIYLLESIFSRDQLYIALFSKKVLNKVKKQARSECYIKKTLEICLNICMLQIS